MDHKVRKGGLQKLLSEFDQFFKDQKEIFAGIVRHDKEKWVIVSFGVHRNITRSEGLALKDMYDLRPTSTGYEGYVDTIVYRNGGRIQKNGGWITI